MIYQKCYLLHLSRLSIVTHRIGNFPEVPVKGKNLYRRDRLLPRLRNHLGRYPSPNPSHVDPRYPAQINNFRCIKVEKNLTESLRECFVLESAPFEYPNSIAFCSHKVLTLSFRIGTPHAVIPSFARPVIALAVAVGFAVVLLRKEHDDAEDCRK